MVGVDRPMKVQVVLCAGLTLCMLGNFACFFLGHLLIFFKINILKNSFRNTIIVSNSLDPDQARHCVGPELGLNCLQG